MLTTRYKIVVKFFVAAWAIEAQKKTWFTTCHKKDTLSRSRLSCVLKNVQNIFVNEMTSLIRLLVGFVYYLSVRKTVNKWLYEEWKVCTHILQWHNKHKLQWDACLSHNLLNDCGSRKVFIITICVLLTMSWSEFQKDCQTIFVRPSCFCQDPFTRSNFYIQSFLIPFSLENMQSSFRWLYQSFCHKSICRDKWWMQKI